MVGWYLNHPCRAENIENGWGGVETTLFALKNVENGGVVLKPPLSCRKTSKMVGVVLKPPRLVHVMGL